MSETSVVSGERILAKLTRVEATRIFDDLRALVEIEGTSGDEGRIACAAAGRAQALPGVETRRIQDNLIVWRGDPQVALFAHLDTVGFTLGYDRELVRIGGPHVTEGEVVRCTAAGVTRRGRMGKRGDCWVLEGVPEAPLGSRWVYDTPLELDGVKVRGPYLDNRAGVWSALEALNVCTDVAVAFTANEEHSGRGAATCARWLYDHLEISQALISDITWHTRFVRRGRGPAVSMRDRNVPRQAYLDRVLTAAASSGIPYQLEIERDGSSDGGAIERSGVPMDWLFVGAPEEASHTPSELLDLNDLRDMARLTAHLVRALSD
jgi:putative aminopeptidase FrvX